VTIGADVADELDVQRLFAETIAVSGGVDAVVHTLGSPVAATPVADFDLGVFDALVRINAVSLEVGMPGHKAVSLLMCLPG